MEKLRSEDTKEGLTTDKPRWTRMGQGRRNKAEDSETGSNELNERGAQMVRYYRWYSNKMRGVRQGGLPPELVIRRPCVSPPPPLKLPSKRWRDLILRVWHVEPLRCPVCQNPMRVIAVIDDPRVVGQILRHLGVWHDPPPRPPPTGLPGPYTYEPCDDVDPMPDYENVLTD